MAYAVGRHWAYYFVSLTITLVLALAANTSFGGLPVLGSLLARDNFLPHIFAFRDDRQVFSYGIWALAMMSGILMIAVDGRTERLIPLFAIGVFTGFTLSQSGLVVHWRRLRPKRWRQRALVNSIGAVATAAATIIFLFTKFTEGAWVVVVAVPLFIFLFKRVHAYYGRAAKALEIGQIPRRPSAKPTIVVVPVAGVSRLAEQAISEALSISHQVVAVSVVMEDAGAGSDGATADGTGFGGAREGTPGGASSPGARNPGASREDAGGGDAGGGDAGGGDAGGGDAGSGDDGGVGSPEADRARQLEEDWIRWGPGVPLRVLRTEYASVVRPIVAFIDDLRQREEEQIMVLIPVAVPERIRYLYLHNHIDVVLERALRGRTDVVIGRVQVPLHDEVGAGSGDERQTRNDEAGTGSSG